jgi:hypothetical protein
MTLEISIDELRNAYGEIAPRISDRRVAMRQLLRSISYCEATGSRAWSATVLRAGYRLNVGQVETLTCAYYPSAESGVFAREAEAGLFLFRLLLSGPNALAAIGQIEQDCSVNEMSYKSVSKQHWCAEIPFPLGRERHDPDRLKCLKHITAVQSAHEDFVGNAAYSPSGELRKKSNFDRFNAPALTRYATETDRPSFTYEHHMWHRMANDELERSDIPTPEDSWETIGPFALTFDGDAQRVRSEDLGRLYCSGATDDLTVLRQTLYNFQRAWRWSERTDITAEELKMVRWAVSEIRRHVQNEA